mmetsp:Transcript_26106/g.60255  ORF Transcript_26106/g.60255 Transcript_26106/m.60255 type:complete len:1373 (+) Transcript_26106:38-4156(+)
MGETTGSGLGTGTAAGATILGLTLQREGKYAAAQVQFQAALDAHNATGDSKSVALLQVYLGSAFLSQGMVPEARVLLEKSLLSGEVEGRDCFDLEQALLNLAKAEKSQGQLAEASAHLKQSLQLRVRALSKDVASLVSLCDDAGELSQVLGNTAEAQSLLQRAAKLKEAGLGDEPEPFLDAMEPARQDAAARQLQPCVLRSYLRQLFLSQRAAADVLQSRAKSAQQRASYSSSLAEHYLATLEEQVRSEKLQIVIEESDFAQSDIIQPRFTPGESEDLTDAVTMESKRLSSLSGPPGSPDKGDTMDSKRTGGTPLSSTKSVTSVQGWKASPKPTTRHNSMSFTRQGSVTFTRQNSTFSFAESESEFDRLDRLRELRELEEQECQERDREKLRVLVHWKMQQRCAHRQALAFKTKPNHRFRCAVYQTMVNRTFRYLLDRGIAPDEAWDKKETNMAVIWFHAQLAAHKMAGAVADKALRIAIRDADVPGACMALQQGASITTKVERSDGAIGLLGFAASLSHYECVDFLLRQGADPSEADDETGMTPLHHAASCTNRVLRPHALKAAELLLAANARIDVMTIDTRLLPLHVAAKCDNVPVFKLLASLEPNGIVGVPRAGEDEDHVIHVAVRGRAFDMVHYLIQSGESLQVVNKLGMTPADLAESLSCTIIVRTIERVRLDEWRQRLDREDAEKVAREAQRVKEEAEAARARAQEEAAQRAAARQRERQRRREELANKQTVQLVRRSHVTMFGQVVNPSVDATQILPPLPQQQLLSSLALNVRSVANPHRDLKHNPLVLSHSDPTRVITELKKKRRVPPKSTKLPLVTFSDSPGRESQSDFSASPGPRSSSEMRTGLPVIPQNELISSFPTSSRLRWHKGSRLPGLTQPRAPKITSPTPAKKMRQGQAGSRRKAWDFSPPPQPTISPLPSPPPSPAASPRGSAAEIYTKKLFVPRARSTSPPRGQGADGLSKTVPAKERARAAGGGRSKGRPRARSAGRERERPSVVVDMAPGPKSPDTGVRRVQNLDNNRPDSPGPTQTPRSANSEGHDNTGAQSLFVESPPPSAKYNRRKPGSSDGVPHPAPVQEREQLESTNDHARHHTKPASDAQSLFAESPPPQFNRPLHPLDCEIYMPPSPACRPWVNDVDSHVYGGEEQDLHDSGNDSANGRQRGEARRRKKKDTSPSRPRPTVNLANKLSMTAKSSPSRSYKTCTPLPSSAELTAAYSPQKSSGKPVEKLPWNTSPPQRKPLPPDKSKTHKFSSTLSSLSPVNGKVRGTKSLGATMRVNGGHNGDEVPEDVATGRWEDEDLPAPLPDSVPDSVPDSGPDSVPDSVPDGEADTVPDTVPDSVHDSGHNHVPDTVPDTVHDSGHDNVPD